MKNLPWGISLIFFVFLLLLIVTWPYLEDWGYRLGFLSLPEVIEEVVIEHQWEVPKEEYAHEEDKDIYKIDVDVEVETIYVIALTPSLSTSVPFSKINETIYESELGYVTDAEDPTVDIVFSTEEIEFDRNEDGAIEEGRIDESMINGTLELRGQSNRTAEQKSYKVKLYDTTELWYGFKTINLNKHYYDKTRIRNKLAYDMFERLEDIVGLRTKFVKMYIMDRSSEDPELWDDEYSFYGLYTFIEQPNKRFLSRHGLDRTGYFYKAEFFEFYQYSDQLKPKDDLTYSPVEFSKVLEIRGDENHEKIIEMLDALNDYSQNINDVVDKYFNRDNMYTWLAANILLDNYDTNSRNFMIYSPLNAGQWYFVPWDYDASLSVKTTRGKWQKGLSNYWGMVLFNRLFKYEENVEELSAKVNEVSGVINETYTRLLVDSYYVIVVDNTFVPPDSLHPTRDFERFDIEYNSLPSLVTEHKDYYFASLENPMPFYLGEPVLGADGYTFSWDYSYDLQGDTITYTFLVASDPLFENLYYEVKDLSGISYTVPYLEGDEIYWRVIATDSEGNWQFSFDHLYVDEFTSYFGLKKYILTQ